MTKVVVEESSKARDATRVQQEEQIELAKSSGVIFHTLNEADKQQMVTMAEPVYRNWEKKIGIEYLNKVRQILR